MALPLAPIRSPRPSRKGGFRDRLIETSKDPKMQAMMRAVGAGDVEKLKSLLPRRKRLNPYECQLLSNASSLEMMKVWISRAPRRYNVDPRRDLTIDQIRELIAAAGRGVILEFSGPHVRTMQDENPALYRRIKARIARDEEKCLSKSK